MRVLVKKIHDQAQLPTQSLDDVGFDLYAAKSIQIGAGMIVLVKTGLELAVDPGEFRFTNSTTNARSLLKIEGRSGMALKGVWPVGGIIDPGYRGEIGVVLFNSTLRTWIVEPGDRIAQIVWYTVIAEHRGMGQRPRFEWTKESEESSRGNKGFGSSGV